MPTVRDVIMNGHACRLHNADSAEFSITLFVS
jgi:hypothetical protein